MLLLKNYKHSNKNHLLINKLILIFLNFYYFKNFVINFRILNSLWHFLIFWKYFDFKNVSKYTNILM